MLQIKGRVTSPLTAEEGFWYTYLLGPLANQGYDDVQSEPVLPEDHAIHNVPHETWSIHGHVHSPDKGTIYIHWNITKRYTHPDSEGILCSSLRIGDENEVSYHYISDSLVHARSSPFEIVMGSKRVQSINKSVLFPMNIETSGLVSIQATLTMLKDPVPWLNGKHGVALAGYQYPSVKVEGTVTMVEEEHAVTGECFFTHEWSYGIVNPTYPPAFLHRAMHAAFISDLEDFVPLVIHVFSTYNIHIRINMLQENFDTKCDAMISQSNGESYTGQVQLSKVGHTVRVEYENISVSFSSKPVAMHLMGSIETTAIRGTLAGSHDGYGILLQGSQLSRFEKSEEVAQLLNVGNVENDGSPSAAQITGAFFFWLVPVVLLAITITMVVLLTKLSSVF